MTPRIHSRRIQVPRILERQQLRSRNLSICTDRPLGRSRPECATFLSARPNLDPQWSLFMVDVHTCEQRSRNMSAIRGKDTRPELSVRSILHTLGYRFRLHRKDLPGRPDIVLPGYGAIIFVHGCFWHCHRCRFGRVQPATRSEFWTAKRQSNVDRDRRNNKALRKLGWRVMVIWECEVKAPEKIRARLSRFLGE